jgi:hypothetical protein
MVSVLDFSLLMTMLPVPAAMAQPAHARQVRNPAPTIFTCGQAIFLATYGNRATLIALSLASFAMLTFALAWF